jgi:hypothetical protein
MYILEELAALRDGYTSLLDARRVRTRSVPVADG